MPMPTRNGIVNVSFVVTVVSDAMVVPLPIVSTPEPTVIVPPVPVTESHFAASRLAPEKLSRNFFWTDFTLSMSSCGS